MNHPPPQSHEPRSELVAVAALLMMLAATTAIGQVIPFDQASATVPGPTTRVDAYGNAAPVAPDRRTVGSLLGVGPWLQAPTGYQLLTQALDRRPLRTEPVITKLREVLMGPDAAKKTRAQSPAARNLGRAFSRYGGFERRSAQFAPMDIRSVLARRYELIQATSRNAPIRRVTWRAGGDVSGVVVPFGAAGSSLMPVVGTNEPTLRKQLQLAAEQSHGRVLAKAWDQFQSSNYRQAASAFSSAMMLDAKDLESRIGELMSLLSNGTTRTAAAAVGELARRFDNPFALELDISSRYGSAVDAVRLRTRAKLVAHADEVNASIAAAYTLALWYLGERHEAIRAADRLEQLHRQSVFGNWAGIIRASTTEQGRDQPAS